MMKIDWTMPKYRQEEHIPFIPDEKNLDLLVASSHSKRMTAYLKCLKDTLADPGEALKIRWCDVSGDIVTINFPVKGHRPRQIQVTPQLIAMLNSLPKTSERIFPVKYSSIFRCYSKLRIRAAALHHDPNIRKIELRSFRHWGATKIAYSTTNNINGVLVAMKILGHKQITSTMKYIGNIAYKEEDYDVEAATTVEEATKLLKAGFKYEVDMLGTKLFKRPTRFSS